ncbi:MAG: RPB7/RPC8 family DNA-directed RNA polymerase subunit, partial [Candidatus ainarchaeum sp.]|nr:RPB7/RPC8 family DNA-directed RNA polymerase subunit [Candidatus ainarchaeum sp.]
MYYVKDIEDKVRVTPDLFKEKTKDAVNRILRKQYERRVFKDLGVVLAVFDTDVLGEGSVIPGDGAAYYNVKFKTLTFMPFVNEVYE